MIPRLRSCVCDSRRRFYWWGSRERRSRYPVRAADSSLKSRNKPGHSAATKFRRLLPAQSSRRLWLAPAGQSCYLLCSLWHGDCLQLSSALHVTPVVSKSSASLFRFLVPLLSFRLLCPVTRTLDIGWTLEEGEGKNPTVVGFEKKRKEKKQGKLIFYYCVRPVCFAPLITIVYHGEQQQEEEEGIAPLFV